jgi:hypothetical protein
MKVLISSNPVQYIYLKFQIIQVDSFIKKCSLLQNAVLLKFFFIMTFYSLRQAFNYKYSPIVTSDSAFPLPKYASSHATMLACI